MKTFDKSFITFDSRYDRKLGFLSPYEENAAGKARFISQLDWANLISSEYNVEIDFKEKKIKDLSKELDLSEFIFDNEPAKGFSLKQAIHRSHYFGGNVKFRVEDPRGFDLEISSDNLAALAQETTIINGVIQDSCVWCREGKDNVLVPEHSELYQEAIKNTKRLNTKTNEYDIGDVIELADAGKSTIVYLGVYTVYYIDKFKDFCYLDGKLPNTDLSSKIQSKKVKAYCNIREKSLKEFKDEIPSVYVDYRSQIKASKVVKKNLLSEEEAKKIIDSSLAENRYDFNSHKSNIVAVSESSKENIIVNQQTETLTRDEFSNRYLSWLEYCGWSWKVNIGINCYVHINTVPYFISRFDHFLNKEFMRLLEGFELSKFKVYPKYKTVRYSYKDYVEPVNLIQHKMSQIETFNVVYYTNNIGQRFFIT